MRKWFFVFLLTWVVTGLFWSVLRQHRLSTGFEKAKNGTSEAEIMTKLGKPWKIGKCGQMFGGDITQSCTKEYLYASPYAPIVPEYWALRFDIKGQLIEKYRYVSP